MEVILTIIGLLITGLVGWFTIVPVIDKTQKDFLVVQPNVVVGGNFMISSGNQYTAVLKLHNLGKTAAYNAKVALDGFPEEKQLAVIHPLRPGHNEYEVSIELGKCSALKTEARESTNLRIVYFDRWNYRYELLYPVTQTPRAGALFSLQILVEKPTLKNPKVSFLKMRKLLSVLPIDH